MLIQSANAELSQSNSVHLKEAHKVCTYTIYSTQWALHYKMYIYLENL